MEVFKNTLPARLYWVVFPIADLGQAVETAKRILTKEKIYRQLAGQSFLTPFMSIKDGYNSKKVTFDMQGSLDDKTDKLASMMSKMTAQDDNLNKQFKPKIYQGKQRGQSRNFYDQNIYDQRDYQNRYRSNSRDRRTTYRCRGQYEHSYRGRPHYVSNYRAIIEEIISEIHKITEVKTLGVVTEGIIEMTIFEEVGVCLGTDNIQIISEEMTEVVLVGQDHVQEPVIIEIELDAISVGNMIILLRTVQLCR